MNNKFTTAKLEIVESIVTAEAIVTVEISIENKHVRFTEKFIVELSGRHYRPDQGNRIITMEGARLIDLDEYKKGRFLDFQGMIVCDAQAHVSPRGI